MFKHESIPGKDEQPSALTTLDQHPQIIRLREILKEELDDMAEEIGGIQNLSWEDTERASEKEVERLMAEREKQQGGMNE
jgi:hypothetical protein